MVCELLLTANLVGFFLNTADELGADIGYSAEFARAFYTLGALFISRFSVPEPSRKQDVFCDGGRCLALYCGLAAIQQRKVPQHEP